MTYYYIWCCNSFSLLPITEIVIMCNDYAIMERYYYSVFLTWCHLQSSGGHQDKSEEMSIFRWTSSWWPKKSCFCTRDGNSGVFHHLIQEFDIIVWILFEYWISLYYCVCCLDHVNVLLSFKIDAVWFLSFSTEISINGLFMDWDRHFVLNLKDLSFLSLTLRIWIYVKISECCSSSIISSEDQVS